MPLVKGVEADCVFSSFSGINALNTWGGGRGTGRVTLHIFLMWLKSYVDHKESSVARYPVQDKKKQTNQKSFIGESTVLYLASSEMNLPLRVRQQLFPASCLPTTHTGKLSSLCVASLRRQMASVKYLNTHCQ